MLRTVTGAHVFAAAITLLPSSVSAMTLVQFFGFLNIFVGLFLTIALILYGTALIIYFTRYGTPHRDESLAFVEWGISILFVLVVLLGIVQYFQSHPANMKYILGTIIFLLLIAILYYVYGVEKKKPAGPPGPPLR